MASLDQQRLAWFDNVLNAEKLSLSALAALCFNGIPDRPGLRALCWKLLLGYLPPQPATWPEFRSSRRQLYRQWLQEFIVNPYEESNSKTQHKPTMATGASDHPLSLDEDSQWQRFFEGQDVLEQIDKDVRRTLPEEPFFQTISHCPHPLVKPDGTGAEIMALNKRVERVTLQTTSDSDSSDHHATKKGAKKPLKQLFQDEDDDALFGTWDHVKKPVTSQSSSHSSTGKETTSTTSTAADLQAQRDNMVAALPATNLEYHWAVLERILFLYAKLNPGVAYIQGMNELLAPIYYVFANDMTPEWRDQPEADAFFCFTMVMADQRDNFIQELDVDSGCGISAKLTEIMRLVQLYDENLWHELVDRDVQPYYFAFRWVTLMLCQEFKLNEVIVLWDSLFSDPNRYEFLLYICAAMIVTVRNDVMEQEFSVVLKTLQSFPQSDLKQLVQLADDILFTKTETSLIANFDRQLRELGFFVPKPSSPSSISRDYQLVLATDDPLA